MTDAHPFRIGLTAFDVLFLAGVGLVPLFGWSGLRAIEIGLLPLLAAPFMWRRSRPQARDWLLLALFAQYGVLVALNYAIAPAAGGSEDKIVLHLGCILLMLLGLIRLRQSFDLATVWRIAAPLTLIFSIALLGWQHASTPAPDHCRVGWRTKDVMYPPLYFGTFALAVFHGWPQLSAAERWLRYAILAVTVMAIIALLGSRGGLLALVLTAPVLALLLGWGRSVAERLRAVLAIGAAMVIGIAAGLALDASAGCGYSDRLVAVLKTWEDRDQAKEITENIWQDRLAEPRAPAQSLTTKVAPAPPSETAKARIEPPSADERLIAGVYIRNFLWQEGLRAAANAPVLGHGLSEEEALTPGDLPHFHQQYMTWLVGGGAILLISGLAMLLSPLAAFGVRRGPDAAILALAAIGPPAVYFLTETFLNHSTNLLAYTMVLSLFHVMSRQSAADRTTLSHDPRSKEIDADECSPP